MNAAADEHQPVIRPLLPSDQQAFLNDEISASQYLDDAYERELSIARLDFEAALRRPVSPGRQYRSSDRLVGVAADRSELRRELAVMTETLSARFQRLALTIASIVTTAILLGVVIFLIAAGQNAGMAAAVAAIITCIAATIIGILTRNSTGE